MSSMIINSAEPEPALAGVLTRHLFADDPHKAHRRWRELFARPAFAPDATAGHTAPAERAYTRLRRVNEAVPDPLGLARDIRELAALHEWAAVVDGALTTVAGIHYNLFLGSLADHAPDPGRDLDDLLAMRRVGTFLCTEVDHGNDAAALETTLVHRPASDDFVLHTPHPGARKFMPNTSLTGGPKSAVVAARLLSDGRDHGVFLTLVPLSDRDGHLPGVTVTPLPARTGSPVDHCLTSFDQVVLPRTALLEGAQGTLLRDGSLKSDVGNKRKRFLAAIGRVTEGKLCMTGAAVGATRAALAIAVGYADRRLVGGFRPAGAQVPLSALRSHQDRLTRAVATGYGLTFLHRSAVRAWAGRTPQDSDAAARHAAVAKAWITWRAREVLVECRERCGAQGLLAGTALSGYPLDIEGTITAEGDNLPIWVKSAADLVFDRDPELYDAPCEDPLHDLRALRDALAADEVRLRRRAARALRSGPARDPLARWNGATPAALDLVGAHAERLAADAFLAAVEAAAEDHAPTARLLRRLCRLFLLELLAPRAGALVALGVWDAETLSRLPDVRDRLTGELGPHLALLTEAFDVPESVRAGVPVTH
ncbi:acyl-CoA dehydrogenase [Streptomyces sp. NPDC048606]|uniref:acyl-CoA dehydrogenase family protein n=1 Tax=Streptomyces sp. NPDC048606 TaxID=3154726 RepID=UPI00344A5450